MTKTLRVISLVTLSLQAQAATAGPAPQAVATGSLGESERSRYAAVVRKVAAMPENNRAQGLVSRTGMQLLNVLWEDTGR